MRGKNQIEFNPVTEGKKDYCDCGCDCGKKICEECGKPHRPENIKEDMKWHVPKVWRQTSHR